MKVYILYVEDPGDEYYDRKPVGVYSNQDIAEKFIEDVYPHLIDQYSIVEVEVDKHPDEQDCRVCPNFLEN